MLLLLKQTRGTKEVGAIQLIGHAIATEADKRYKRGAIQLIGHAVARSDIRSKNNLNCLGLRSEL